MKLFATLIAICAVLSGDLHAQTTANTAPSTSHYITMEDGVRLAVFVDVSIIDATLNDDSDRRA